MCDARDGQGTALAVSAVVEAIPMAHLAKRPSFRFASLVSVAAVTGALLLASCDDSVPPGGGITPPTKPSPGAMPNPGSTMPPAQIGQTDFTTEEGAGNATGNTT